MKTEEIRRVRVLMNRKSGLFWSLDAVRRALAESWESRGIDVTFQFCRDPGDGADKARRAVADAVDVVMVVGGDGSINSIGSVLVGTDVVLATLPAGSGNGFARHFDIPLSPDAAAKALIEGKVARIDVGKVQGQPFFVTCSLAWDASIIRSFEKMPVRGILPYVFAGVYEFFEYTPQELVAEIDGRETLRIPDPLVFTIANLSQYGGGAIIAPEARADDGYLELVAVRRRDAHILIANAARLFTGSIGHLSQVYSRRFQSLTVRRSRPGLLQIDGELSEAETEVTVSVVPRGLRVLLPMVAAEQRIGAVEED